MPKTQSAKSAPSAPSTLFIKKSPQSSTKVPSNTPPPKLPTRQNTLPRPAHRIDRTKILKKSLSNKLSNKFGSSLKNKFRSFFKGKNRIALEDITNVMNP